MHVFDLNKGRYSRVAVPTVVFQEYLGKIQNKLYQVIFFTITFSYHF